MATNDLSFGKRIALQFPHRIVTGERVFKGREKVPKPLLHEIRDPALEAWFSAEASRRRGTLPSTLAALSDTKFERESDKTRAALEMGNRAPDRSMHPLKLAEMIQMGTLCLSPKDILDRARQGVELLRSNPNQELGTAARGIPAGGASTRAATWAREHAETAANFGIGETTPRFLYRVAGKTLLQWTIECSRHIGRSIGRVFPNIIMTNSEIVAALMAVVAEDWGTFKPAELANTVFFNQIVMPRMWAKDQQMIKGKLYPAGHGDYPYLLATYNMAKTLRSMGIKYLVFSNGDEWQFQADPVMISIAQELFNHGNHMVIIGVENTNRQLGGGFVKKTDGSHALVETPRLPWEIMKSQKPPVALNTSFYIVDVDFLAEHEADLLNVEKSLVVKDTPGRTPGDVEQVFGVDSWAGDVFSAVLNPAFIQWHRLNFLGIKDGSHITGADPIDYLGGRTYLHYVHEAASAWPVLISRLISGDVKAAEFLHRTDYSYLEPRPGNLRAHLECLAKLV